MKWNSRPVVKQRGLAMSSASILSGAAITINAEFSELDPIFNSFDLKGVTDVLQELSAIPFLRAQLRDSFDSLILELYSKSSTLTDIKQLLVFLLVILVRFFPLPPLPSLPSSFSPSPSLSLSPFFPLSPLPSLPSSFFPKLFVQQLKT